MRILPRIATNFFFKLFFFFIHLYSTKRSNWLLFFIWFSPCRMPWSDGWRLGGRAGVTWHRGGWRWWRWIWSGNLTFILCSYDSDLQVRLLLPPPVYVKVTRYPGFLSEGKRSLSVVVQAQIEQVWWSGCWDPIAGQTFLGLCLVLREGRGSIFLVIHISGDLYCVGRWEAVGLELCWGRVSYLARRICRFVGAG